MVESADSFAARRVRCGRLEKERGWGATRASCGGQGDEGLDHWAVGPSRAEVIGVEGWGWVGKGEE